MAEEASKRAGVADPGRVHSRQDFADELTLLRERAGLTVRDVAKVAQVPVATAGGYFSGRHTPAVKPPDVLRRILSACGVQDADTIGEWLDALRRVRRTPGRPAAGAPVPYRGLACFQPEDAEWFYGRQRLTETLIEQLASQCLTGDFIAAVGPSGSGKSSLLRAGLIPALRSGALGQPGSKSWPIALFTPGARPLHALASQLAAFTGADADQLATSLLSRPDRCADLLSPDRGVEADSAGPAGDRDGQEQGRVVLVVDQFEEIFTACRDEGERRSFIAALHAAAQCHQEGASEPGGSGPAALVVLGLRADFYAHALRYPEMVSAVQDHQVVVGPMTEPELRSVIVEPARKAKLEIEDGLVEVLLHDLAPAGYSPSAAAPARAHYRCSPTPC